MSRNQSGTVVLHPFSDDGQPDHRGQGRCTECGLPATNRAHRLPARSEDERAVEARRLGEDE